MDEDDEDLYGRSDTIIRTKQENGPPNDVEGDDKDEEMDESEDDNGDDSDSDIDIITERAQGAGQPEAAQDQPARHEVPSREQARSTTVESKPVKRAAGQKRESASQEPVRKSGADYAEVHTSKVDTDANPVYPPVGKPVTDLDFDVDLAEYEKAWRRPGSNQADWFNYGFDEFTWATYCLKQKSVRGDQEAESAQIKMMLGGGVPGMPGAPQSQHNSGQSQGQQNGHNGQMTGSMPPMPGMPGFMGMPGMPEMTPDMMNQMMQQMMAGGIDPSQMDLNMFAQQFGQVMGGPPAGSAGQSGFPSQSPMDGMSGGGGGQDNNRPRGGAAGYQNRGRGRRW